MLAESTLPISRSTLVCGTDNAGAKTREETNRDRKRENMSRERWEREKTYRERERENTDGVSLTASSISLPLGVNVWDEDHRLAEKLRTLGKRLNLKPHTVLSPRHKLS